eukprot:scaffold25494_cov146-Isochrysis_galbana.AAC.1
MSGRSRASHAGGAVVGDTMLLFCQSFHPRSLGGPGIQRSHPMKDARACGVPQHVHPPEVPAQRPPKLRRQSSWTAPLHVQA